MSNVWVFGDSYVVDHGLDWQWYKQYARMKNKTAHAMADYGVANSWISMQLYEYHHNNHIQPGDTVIVVTTHCIRHWFLWDHPNISNYQNMMNLDPAYFGITKDQIRAVEYYYKHIQSGYQDAFLYDSNTAWLNHYAEKFAGMDVDTILIQGWNNATDVKHKGSIPIEGCLFESVCSMEFKDQKRMDEWYYRDIPDQRVNHMMRDNHTVLAEALATKDSIVMSELPWRKGELSVGSEAMLKNQLSPKLLR